MAKREQETVLGIIGHPVSHSLSPFMHNEAAALLKLSVRYCAFEVGPGQVKKALEGMRALGIRGLNVTVPHKESVIPFLDALSDEAEAMGAVNTILNKDGKLTGFNTDGHGFIRSLKEEGFKPRGRSAVIIGAGGSSRAIGISLLRAGLKQVTVINRTETRGEDLARLLRRFGGAEYLNPESGEALQAAAGADLVVQTTSAGMKRSDPLPLKGARFRKGQYVYDIIYSPFETRLLKKAKKEGARTLNGLGMLLYQGSGSFKVWTGRRFPEEKVYKKLKKLVSGGR